MRFEGKSEADAVEKAARELGRPAEGLGYRVTRDEKSFWGGRVVEIEIEGSAAQVPAAAAMAGEPDMPAESDSSLPGGRLESRQGTLQSPELPGSDSSRPGSPESRQGTLRSSEPPGSRRGTWQPPQAPEAGAPLEALPGKEAFATVEATLAELLSAAGLLVEIRRSPSEEEMVFELIGDDVEPLLANRGEGLNGLEVLTGRIAGKRLGQPVHPRLDAEGFRVQQRESLEELARKSAEEVKRTHRAQLLPPLPPGERRLVHLALSQDPDVETESEGQGFLKRVSVRPKAG